ncbi:MAG: aldehyde dehydrogenase [Hyphomonadaceae bacterium]
MPDTVSLPGAEEAFARARATTWRMLIGGEWVDARSGETFEVRDPSNGRVIAVAPSGAAADIDAAVAAARDAFTDQRWLRLGGVERGKRLMRLAELIEANAAELQALETLNNGVPSNIAQYFTFFAADAFRYYAGWCSKIYGSTSDISTPEAQFHAYTHKEPVGVAGLIVPWNGPLASASMKLATALAAGCTCVLKPAEETPLSALWLGELVLEAGIPAGVVNIVTGFGHTAGAALAAHPDVDKVSFTGSTEVGKKIVQAAAGNLKKVSLELGGKSPVVILDDANLDKAIPGAALGTFFNTGQVCVAGSRVFVQRNIYDRVVDGMASVGASLRIGPGFDPSAQIGPLISHKQLDRVVSLVDGARGEGAEVIGGGRHGDDGYFYKPAVVTHCASDATILREEVFGPVLTALPFDDFDEAVKLANDTSYGLAAAVWSESLNKAHRFAKAVQAGTVWINCQLVLNSGLPFGGYKQSGWGRENGVEGLESFMQSKTVMAMLDA